MFNEVTAEIPVRERRREFERSGGFSLANSSSGVWRRSTSVRRRRPQRTGLLVWRYHLRSQGEAIQFDAKLEDIENETVSPSRQYTRLADCEAPTWLLSHFSGSSAPAIELTLFILMLG